MDNAEALRALEVAKKQADGFGALHICDAIDKGIAALKAPGYVRVPVELIETLRDMSDRQIRIGTVLTVDMNYIALHLDMLAAANKETSHD